ncbi:MAG: bile acid:sodium symporter family protein [Gammaproteobacteria bacterium]|nr:bile acid:sodium symporter family protein [Gammaproteobacteria bacterium]
MAWIIQQSNRLFPLWAILFAFAGYLLPDFWTDLKPFIIPLLVVVMFTMGMTLTWDDFVRALRSPRLVFIGMLLQYTVMPLVAWLLAIIFKLSADLTVGLLLVGTTAGGTASNVITYLSKGDLALSITLTLCSTLLAVVAMPWLTWLYIGHRVPVPALDMVFNLLKIVLIPVVAGTFINSLFRTKIKKMEPIFPLLSIFAIAVIIAIIVALNASQFQTVGIVLMLAVILHNASGLVTGYWVAKLLGYDSRISRTLAIEVGMQNSGLSVALAFKYFSPLAALPGALFSIWHNLSGSLFAAYWSRKQSD